MKNKQGKIAVFLIIIFILLAVGAAYWLLDIYTPDENSGEIIEQIN
ncbi:hypothetical protein [Ornithinibacillus sp. 179-J 7C1 HS]